VSPQSRGEMRTRREHLNLQFGSFNCWNIYTVVADTESGEGGNTSYFKISRKWSVNTVWSRETDFPKIYYTGYHEKM
jgi:hypothetical protein